MSRRLLQLLLSPDRPMSYLRCSILHVCPDLAGLASAYLGKVIGHLINWGLIFSFASRAIQKVN